jgi:hypothetical protein
MSKLLSVASTKILHDEQLRKNIILHLESVMKDGKVDISDIPDIMLIVMECTNNLDKFSLSYDELVCVLEEVIVFILDEAELVQDEKREDFTRMIKSTIKLVLLQPKIKSTLSNLWNKVKNLLCCGKNNSTNSNEVKEVTHTVHATQVPEPLINEIPVEITPVETIVQAEEVKQEVKQETSVEEEQK